MVKNGLIWDFMSLISKYALSLLQSSAILVTIYLLVSTMLIGSH